MPKKVYIAVSGCNRRLLEASKIQNYLDINGYVITCTPEDADYIVLSTCAFKEKEEDLSVSAIEKYKKYKNAELLIFGCLPKIAPKKFEPFKDHRTLAPKELSKIDTFFEDIKINYSEVADTHLPKQPSSVGPLEKALSKISSGEVFSKEFYLTAMFALREGLPGILNKELRNYYLFVCRGCLGLCSYCAIKRSIGTVVSQPVEKITENFRQGYQEGYRKFVILGDDPGSYGIDININLPKLLESLNQEWEMLSSNNGHSREVTLNLNEIHPKFLLEYENCILELSRKKLIASILCPIQSGNSRVLQLMRREHKAEELSSIFRKIQIANPALKISTQLIVGFPTETDEDFQDSLDLVLDINFYSVTLFPYHKKENTPASRLEGSLTQGQIDRRLKTGLNFLRSRGIRAYTSCIA